MHTPVPGSAAKPLPRHDIYCAIHKALRLFMTDTLARVGRLDTGDAADVADTVVQLRQLLNSCRGHVARENCFLHPALEARRPGASSLIGAEHDEHLEAIATLEAEADALAARPEPAAALRLYRLLSRFVAENFDHMLVEENRHNAVLWEAYSDAELEALHGRLVASVPAAEMQLLLSWMLAALSPAERAHLQAAPADAGSVA
jgi:hemerythrin-like domain-containing protein